MARARNIKPGFFANDALAECEPMARLLFIGLWTLADREGRLEDRPKRIKGQLFPFDNCDVEGMLEELCYHNFIQRYHDGKHKVIQIPNFGKHQRPHANEPKSAFAPPSVATSTIGESTSSNGQSASTIGASASENGASTSLLMLNAECLMLNDERGMINEELGIQPVANCEDESSEGKEIPKHRLTADQIDQSVDRAIILRRKVPVSDHSEAFALCRIAALELMTLPTSMIEDAAEQTRQRKPARPAAYFVKTIMHRCQERGEPIRDAFTAIMFPRDRVQEVLEAVL